MRVPVGIPSVAARVGCPPARNRDVAFMHPASTTTRDQCALRIMASLPTR